ncbi:phosphatidylserine/phosphatidylglycerophosphate/cardiolipin synthase family protein [Candidatus Parcubacteria bacterium]|nr:MAG: phosphatidylserine/phosphatidylglycerophosphate/cardiolipin synthase family protein [Candidatus Parcubacteria bacterium]
MKAFYRRIFKSQQTGVATIRELLQSMFVGEMLRVEEQIWIVSPWISNVVLIDNRSGNFDTLNPEWGRREIRLVDVLIALMARGSQIVIVTRNLDTNTGFLDKLRDETERYGLEHQLTINIKSLLHTKGILLSKSLLLGSMNLTYNGLEMNDEWIQFSIDPHDIASTRLEFGKYMEKA